MEKAIFPMKYLNVSQGMNGSYSHQGTQKIDLIGSSGSSIDNVYAPYTGIIKKIYASGGNSVWLESQNPVKYADGTEDYMTIMFTHDNDISNLSVGKVIRQGDPFYQEGTAGEAYGSHVQLDVGRGKLTGNGWHENESGKWVINNEYDPTKALWLKNDTIIINDGGYKWQKTDTNIYVPANTYIVKAGDTLRSIASKYGLTWQELYNNNINVIGSNPNALKIGQMLSIPNNNYYTVVSGDTLISIANRFNTTWQKIYDDNKNIIGDNPSILKIGQRLIINV